MKVRHPRAHPDVPGKPPAKIDTPDGLRELDDDGVFGHGRNFAEWLAAEYDVPFDCVDASVALDDVDLSGDGGDGGEPDGESEPDGGGDPDTCQTVKADGEVCGRDLPCPYHTDED